MQPLYQLIKKEKDDAKFHKTKLLLMIYRQVVWRVENAICEVNDTAYELGGRRIANLVDFLSFGLDDLDSLRDKQVIEERLLNIAESKIMIEIVDKALLKLRTHPDNGVIYFNIITSSYINKEKLTDDQIRRKYHLAPSTYYRYKKKALNLLGVILWGYILPSLRDVWLLGGGGSCAAEERPGLSG
ncbi:MAG TPA: hypothetical protein DEF34_04985 [Desulfotomaculum sp.]|nr:MAG: hypothetical protein JL56_15630 [Desulfotomaculum sp. BICA1-6]HBX22972.1 hypothetical protein [Desulfotomaculum sp.]